MIRIIRSIVGSAGLVIRRRARRDLPLLLAWTAIIAMVIVIAMAGPRYIQSTLDSAARQTVADHGAATDLVVRVKTGRPQNGVGYTAVRPRDLPALAAQIRDTLPPALETAYGSTTIRAVGPSTTIDASAVEPALVRNDRAVRVALLDTTLSSALQLDDGTLPDGAISSADAPIPVVVPAAAGIPTGTTIRLAPGAVVRVVGVVSRADRQAPAALWQDIPKLWSPDAPITLFAAPDAVEELSFLTETPFTATVRIAVKPSAFSSELIAGVISESRILEANSSTLAPSSGYVLTVRSTAPAALSHYAAEARTALAQLSMIVVGVLGAAVTVLILASRLLATRRVREVALERARGASLAGVAVRALGESVGVVAVAVAIAIAASALGTGAGKPPAPGSLVLGVVVVLIALVAVPLQTVLGALDGIRRIPANRQDRAAARSHRRAIRIAAEVSILTLAAGAVIAFLGRGLRRGGGVGIDPLVAAAPLLAALAVTIVVIRLYPIPVRALTRAVRDAPGVLGILAVVRAQRMAAVLPLFALTLAISLATSNAVLASTVAAGQDEASWQRVGADFRHDGPLPEDAATRVSESAGVIAATAVTVVPGVPIDFGSSRVIATVLAVDEDYADAVDALPPVAGVDTPSTASLRRLTGQSGEASPIPVVASKQLAELLATADARVNVGDEDVPVLLDGTFEGGPTGYRDGPFLYVSSTALGARLDAPLPANELLAFGPGAARAANDVGLHGTSRQQWLRDRRDSALTSGVQDATVIASVALAVFAAAALIATLVAGARDRTRTLGLLRTLGSRPRLGWWLAFADLAPIVIAALIGGLACGLGLTALITPALGLQSLTRGPFVPLVTVSPQAIVTIISAIVLLAAVAVVVETSIESRRRLGTALRVGDTV